MKISHQTIVPDSVLNTEPEVEEKSVLEEALAGEWEPIVFPADGKEIEMDSPDIPVDLLVPLLINTPKGEEGAYVSVAMQTKTIEAVLYVRRIDSEIIPVPQTKAAYQQLCLKLGNKALKKVKSMHSVHFPDDDLENLKATKKNSRK